jgi:hypothetical protein
VSTYVSTDIYEDVWLRCDEHPGFTQRLGKGSSMAEVSAIVKAHNEHALAGGCGSVLVPANGVESR